MAFLEEIRRRKIFQVAAVYAVTAWLLVQIVVSVEQPLSLPDWVDTFIIVCLAIGFPITLIMSWAFNLTSAGLVRDEGPVAPTHGRTIEYVLAGLVVLAIGWLIYRVEFDTAVEAAAVSSAALGGQPADDDARLTSVAVLPFLDLSAAGDQDHFVIGMADEVIAKLGRIPGLRVPALTSSLVFQDRREDVRLIGERLGVETILEGTVRRSGDELRITVQLIRASDGFRIWGTRYEEQLVDVFPIQEQVADGVVDALEVELGSDFESSVRPTANLAAYEDYLLGKRAAFSRTEAGLREASGHFAAATQRDPRYAEAYARLAWTYWLLVEYEFDTVATALPRMVESAEQGFVADPDDGEVLTAMSLVRSCQQQWADAAMFGLAAVETNSSSAEAHLYFAVTLERMLHANEAIEEYREAVELDPLDPNANRLLGRALLDQGNTEDGTRLLETALELNPMNRYIHADLAEAYARAGRDAEAIHAFLAGPLPAEIVPDLYAVARAGNFRDLYARFLELEVQRTGRMCTNDSDAGANLYYFLGRLDEVFECLNERIDGQLPIFGYWHARIADDPQYAALIERLGLVSEQTAIAR